MKKLLAAAVLLGAFMATPVMAKEGLYIGGFFPTTTISGNAGGGSSKTGVGLRLGNGYNKYFSVEGNYSSVDTLTGYAVDVKINFPLTTLDTAQIMSIEPYAILGYDYFEMGSSTKIKSNGVQYGVGVELYIFRELSVNGGWTKSAASFDTTPKLDGTITTIDLGVIYHFL